MDSSVHSVCMCVFLCVKCIYTLMCQRFWKGAEYRLKPHLVRRSVAARRSVASDRKTSRDMFIYAVSIADHI